MAVKLQISGLLNIENYTDAVSCCGAEFVAGYLPDPDLSCDGLILCGGVDVDPARYGEGLNGAKDIDLNRDAAEFALLKAFVASGKPVFGICRGCQLINVYFGGTLYQHMTNTVLHRSYTTLDREHEVEVVPGSIVEKLYGKRYTVNSVHHQSIKKLGEGLVVNQLSDDGVIEGIEHTTLPVLAVQWHPERLIFDDKRRHAVDGKLIFKHFIDMCK